LFSLTACQATAEAITGEVRSVLQAQVQAWNQDNMDGFLEGYEKSETLSFASSDGITRGFNSMSERFKIRYEASNMGQLAFEDLEIHPLSSDAAWVLGRYVLTDRPKPSTGVFTVLLVRGEEGFKIVHDHTSALERSP
jgi:hypothetical protein